MRIKDWKEKEEKRRRGIKFAERVQERTVCKKKKKRPVTREVEMIIEEINKNRKEERKREDLSTPRWPRGGMRPGHSFSGCLVSDRVAWPFSSSFHYVQAFREGCGALADQPGGVKSLPDGEKIIGRRGIVPKRSSEGFKNRVNGTSVCGYLFFEMNRGSVGEKKKGRS